MDYWHRRTGCEQSIMTAVNCHSNQYLNWTWWSAYHSSDSSWQCHSVAKNTGEWLSGLAPGLRQLCHLVTHSYSHGKSPNDPSQYTLCDLRAWHLSKTHSTVDLHSTVWCESVVKLRPCLEFSGVHVTSTHRPINRMVAISNHVSTSKISPNPVKIN